MQRHQTDMDHFISASFTAFLENTQDIVFLKDVNLVYRGASQSFAALTNKNSPADLVGCTDFEVFDDQELAKRYRDDDQRLMKSGKSLLDYIEPMPGEDGEYAYSSTSKFIVRDAQGQVIGMWGVARDVTREYRARLQYERELQQLFEMPEDTLTAALLDITGWRVVDYRTKVGKNNATAHFETMDRLLADLCDVVIEGDEARTFFETFSTPKIQEIYNSGKRSFSFEYLRHMPEDRQLWVRTEFHFLTDPVNGSLLLLATVLDIDAEHQSRISLAHAAEHDSMTGLLNRDATMRYIEEYLQREGASQPHALFLVDLDNFKAVNDTFGHQMGDTVLMDVSALIRANFRDTDIVGRIGGDEFFALMKGADSVDVAQAKAQTLVAALQYVCTTSKASVKLSCSVGISLAAAGEKTLPQLYAEADAALYDAKGQGKNRYAVSKECRSAEQAASSGPSVNTVNLHVLLNQIDAGIIIFHADSAEALPRPVFFSDSLLDLMGGLTHEEAREMYSDTLSCVHPDDVKRVHREYEQAFRAGTRMRTTLRHIGKNGAYFWVSIGSNITRYPDDSYDVYSVYTSIENLMKTEAELREKSRILDLAMTNTDINLWFWDVRTKVCTLTPNCRGVHGMDVDQLEDFPECLFRMQYVCEESVEAVREAFCAVENGTPEVLYDAWYHQSDGKGSWCERAVLTTIFDEAGKPLRAICIGKNVTATKEFERKYLAIKNGLRPQANAVDSCIVNLSDNRCVEGEACAQLAPDTAQTPTAAELFGFLQTQAVRAGDRELLRSHFSREALLQRYALGNASVSLEYIVCGADGVNKWLRTTADMLENPETGALEALIYCVDIDEDKRLQLTMETLLVADYEALGQINAQNGRMILLAEKQGAAMLRHDCTELDYDNHLYQLIYSSIVEEYCEECIYALLLATVRSQLEEKPLYTCTFPTKQTDSMPEGYRQWRFSYLDETRTVILVTRSDVTDLFSAETDPLTGLFNRQAFYRHVRERLRQDPDGAYVLVRCDLDRFKAYNDAFGTKAGDKLLADMGRQLCASSEKDNAIWARLDADHFVALGPDIPARVEQWSREQTQWLEQYSPSFRLTCSVGAYHVTDPEMDVSFMCDRALLALKTVKGRYDFVVGWYDDSLRRKLIEEQLLIDASGEALAQNQFVVYYQPQINYSDGSMIGAEALVRWNHPQRGLLGPGYFVPLFEKNGFVSRMDEAVWEMVCRYMQRWSQENARPFPVPISVNLSRVNLYNKNLCDKLEALVCRYDIPRENLRLEITESAYMDNPEQLISVVKRLKRLGFTVEMDDFGAGYSSLNTLKDVPVDVLKLDVRFLSSSEDNARGGSILDSVIRMAHWLQIPVVAEGVETKYQADYLKSLSCFYMQGYHFSHPIPEEEFSALLAKMPTGTTNRFVDTDLSEANEFWDPTAQNALLFNSYVGGAIIVEYYEDKAEILRANDRYFEEIHAQRDQYFTQTFNLLDSFPPEHAARYRQMLETVVENGGEAACEVFSKPLADGTSVGWVSNRARLLAKNENRMLIYVAVQNITPRKEMEEELRLQQQELRLALSQMGALMCRYHVNDKTLMLPDDYAAQRGVPNVHENVPDSVRPHIMEQDWPLYKAMFAEISGGAQKGQASVRFVRKNGDVIVQHHAFTTVFDSHGRPARAIISIRYDGV